MRNELQIPHKKDNLPGIFIQGEAQCKYFWFIGEILHNFEFLPDFILFICSPAKMTNFNSSENVSFIFYCSNVSYYLQLSRSQTFFIFLYCIMTILAYLSLLTEVAFLFFSYKKTEISSSFFIHFMKNYYFFFQKIHPWIFLLPMNDIFLTVFTQDQSFSILIYLVALTIGINLYLCFSSLWLNNQNLKFAIDENLNGAIILKTNVCVILEILLRLIISVFSHFFFEIKEIFFLILHGIFIVNLIKFRDISILNRKIIKFYYGCCFAFEFILICLTFFEYSEIISNDQSLFYVIMILICFSFRLGQKVFENLYQNNFFRDIPNNELTIFYLEEIFYLRKSENFLCFTGILAHHFKFCNDFKCKQLEKQYKCKKIDEKLLRNKFFTIKFKKLLRNSPKNSKNYSFYLIKYASFLAISNDNPVKAYFEIQKMRNLHNLPHQTLFHKISIKFLLKSLENKIMSVKNNNNFKESNANEQSIDVETFFKIKKLQDSYEKELKELIKCKRIFWENYQIEMKNSEELMQKIIRLTKKIQIFYNKIVPTEETSKNISFHAIQLKYMHIFYILLFNSLDHAHEYEEKYQNFIKREIHNKTNENLQILSFLDDSISTIMVSFLKYHGSLLNHEKNEKTAEFFGYTQIEFANINKLTALMPQ